MLNLKFSSQSKKFFKKAENLVAKRISERIEKLVKEPFLPDIKRVEGEKEKFTE